MADTPECKTCRGTGRVLPQCEWHRGWVGRCKESVAVGSNMCPEHAGKACRSCGAPAVLDCEDTMGPLVCGAPLCNECHHNYDPQTSRSLGHVRKPRGGTECTYNG